MIYHFPTEFFHQNLSLRIKKKKHPSQRLGNPCKINLFSVYCYSVKSAEASVCNQLSHSECKPTRGCLFHSFIIGEHAGYLSRLRLQFSLICKFLLIKHDALLWLVVSSTTLNGAFGSLLFTQWFAPSAVRCRTAFLLLCLLIVGIHASGISIPLSLLMLLGWSLTWIASLTLRV